MDMIQTFLSRFQLSDRMESLVASVVLGILLVLVCVLANAVTKSIILRLVHKVVKKTKFTWDDQLMKRGVLTRLSHLVPGLILYYGAQMFSDEDFVGWLQRLAMAYIVLCIAYSIHALLNAVHDLYRRLPSSTARPITGYVQTIQLLVWFAAAVFVIASLLNRSPAAFFTGLGALSAVLMLVFRDSIMGLVAGIQITANDMVRIGDWIEMPKYGADGDVIDISLHTVKVQNWDKTVSTIPTHALINDSFKNWRGMQESGGRRIKRALMIDLNSVTFCDEELLARLDQIALLKGYLKERREQITAWNQERQVTEGCPVNGRRMTNLGTFRAYIEAYLHDHPLIHQEGMTFLVRQLAPTEKGVPIELYVFVSDTRWVKYESIQADIFDHLFAAIPWFNLRLYQAPSGADVERALTISHARQEARVVA
jgi:miniconductance mechanosensitive channel